MDNHADDEEKTSITFCVKQSYFRHFGVTTEFDPLDFFRVGQVVALQKVLQLFFRQNIGNFADEYDSSRFPHWVMTCIVRLCRRHTETDGRSAFLSHWRNLFPGIVTLD